MGTRDARLRQSADCCAMMGEWLRTFHVASLLRLQLLRPPHLLPLPTRLVPRQQTLALLGVLDVQPS